MRFCLAFRYVEAPIVPGALLVPNMRMGKPVHNALLATLALTVTAPAYCDLPSYQQGFSGTVKKFANLNRLSLERLNRDVHANCYIPLTIATTIRGDGSVKDATIVKSSSVPVVDRYYLFVIEQAAPFPPLAKHFDPAPEEITLTQEFAIDVRLWTDGIPSVRKCEELKPRETS